VPDGGSACIRYIDKSKGLFLTRLDESIKNSVITCVSRDRVARRHPIREGYSDRSGVFAMTLIPREHEISAAT
jgi:hypothetical protein